MLIDNFPEVVDGRAKVKVHEPFVDGRNRDFESIYKRIDGPVKRIDIDMMGVKTMDDAGLGRLILLRKHYSESKVAMHIVNCSTRIRRVLFGFNMDRYFHINPV
ncbi:MAG: STAS domain-containing protein [Pseudomonadales bacterium]|nr:STAS domain-containing protein [Pseudomonadales bacterium]